jgi:hypothetical protein
MDEEDHSTSDPNTCKNCNSVFLGGGWIRSGFVFCSGGCQIAFVKKVVKYRAKKAKAAQDKAKGGGEDERKVKKRKRKRKNADESDGEMIA